MKISVSSPALKRLLACMLLPLLVFACTGISSAADARSGSKQTESISAVKADLFLSSRPVPSAPVPQEETGPGIRTNPDAHFFRQILGYRLQQASRTYNALTRHRRHCRHERVIYPFHGFW